MISNPPFGVDWSEYKTHVEKLKDSRYKGNLTPINDGALLFLLTMIEKMKPKQKGGSKIAILFNGSPLSNGDATQSESEIRRYILEHDLLETIVMLPDQMFYNTGIYTYIWLLSNNKPESKKDKVLIINARRQFEKEPKAFGNKRNRITDEHRKWIQQQFKACKETEYTKQFHTKDFAYHKVEVVFWQEDENGQQMWINEDFGVKLTNANAQKRFELYSSYDILIDIVSPFEENECISIQFKYDGKKPMETLVAEHLKKKVGELKQESIKEIKKWFDQLSKAISFYHRYYIVDNEYIPFDRTQECDEQGNWMAERSRSHINAFLTREIDYQIITWTAYDQLGYEILPNKYFYKYQEPTPSDDLIKEFWQLEKDAEKLLNEIREL